MSNVVDYGYLDDEIVGTRAASWSDAAAAAATWVDSFATAATWALASSPSDTWRSEQLSVLFDSQPGNFDDDATRTFDAH